MSKRAPILSENYNPVGERLRRILQPAPSVFMVPEAGPNISKDGTGVSPTVATTMPSIETFSGDSRAVMSEREPIPAFPTDRELKSVSVRFRCTLSERKKWHEITRELTGDHNNLSHFVRAAMLLVESAHEPLRRVAADIQRLRKPATTDALGITLFEQRLAQHLYDALRAAGRPKG